MEETSPFRAILIIAGIFYAQSPSVLPADDHAPDIKALADLR